jgi:exodeoxyribonuclease VII large subunit
VDCSRRLERHQRLLLSRHPRLVIGRSRAQLVPLQQKLTSAMRAHLVQKKSQLGQSGASLHALSPLSVLGRGFALASAPGQRVLRDTKTLSVGDEVTVVLQKGAFIAKVQKVVFGVDYPSALHHESTDSGKSR